MLLHNQRGSGYVFFPIPNHLRIFAMRLAIGRVYAVSPTFARTEILFTRRDGVLRRLVRSRRATPRVVAAKR